MRTPSSSLYLARKLTSTTVALLLVTGFITMVVPIPIVNNNNTAAAELFTSQTTEAIANILAKTDSLQQHAGLPFVQNEGQLHTDVRFYIDTFAGRVYVTDHGLTYSLKNAESNTGMAIKETFVHASSVRPFGTDQNQAVVNHYAGEQSNWRSSIATFDKVSFGEVWNGINVELNAASNNVEKVFTVAPGANLMNIQVAAEGASSLNLNYQGQLVIDTDIGQVVLTKPVAFQEINGQIHAVEVSYVVGQNNQYGFAVGSEYDPDFALVIDPLLASTYLGGTDDEGVSPSTLNPSEGADIAFDSGGNVYIAGLTLSEDYPTTTALLPDPGVNSDVVVSKLSADLSQLLASTIIAGDELDESADVAIESSGDVYVTGRTNSTNFPTTVGADDDTLNDGIIVDEFDAFVTKLDSDLELVASTYLGGSDSDEAFDIAINGAGNVYIVGHTFSADYPTVAGSFDTSFNAPGQAQGFVTSLQSDLTGLVRSTFIGGNNDSRLHAVAIPASGEIYVAGFTLAQDFPIVGGYQATKSNQNQHDTTIAILDSSLTSIIRSTYHGAGAAAGEHTTPFGLAVTDSGKVYIAGLTASSTFPTTVGAYDTSFGGGPRDAYVSVLPDTLDSLEASTFIGGTANDIATGLALSGTSVYITVSGGGVTYPTTPGAFDEGNNDAFISKLSLDLGDLEASTSLGGANTDVLTAIGINPAGDVVVLGHSRSTDFPMTPGTYSTAKAGGAGTFDFTISKLSADLSATPPTVEGTIAFTSDRDGNQEIYIMNADGTGQTRLTNNAALDQHPSISPDGTKIAFETNRDGGNFEIYVMDIDGTDQVNLSSSPGFDAFPDWSPDGSQLAFTSDRDGNQEIYIMNADGTGQTRLTTNPAFDAHPSWGGPFPIEIFFDSTRDGDLEIYKIRTSNLVETRLTTNPASDAFPDISVGGTIGFTSDRDGNFEIYSMNSLGSNQQRLTFNPADDREPSYAKDGSENLGFRSDRGGNKEIYIANFDGSGAVNVSNNPFEDIEPDFGPVLDNSPPTATIAINGGAINSNNLGVTIELTCDDGLGSGCASAVLEITDPGANTNANPGADLELHLHVRSTTDPIGANIVAFRPDDTGDIYTATFALTNSPPQPNAVGYTAGDTIFVSHVYHGGGFAKTAKIKFEDASGNMGTFVTDAIALNPSTIAGHWALDEGTGQTVGDDSAFGHTGVLGSNPNIEATDPAWVAGNVGTGALDFDGVDDFVSVTSAPTLWLTSGFTAATWVKLDSLPVDNYVVLSKWTSGIEDIALDVGPGGEMFFSTHPCGTAVSSGSSVLTVGSWHHVAVVHDGLQNRIYIDGQQAGSVGVCDPMWNANANLYFGASFRTDGVQPRYLDGQLDDIQWYQRALSGGEILTIFQGGPVPTDLELNPIRDVTASTGFTVSGTFTNANTGEGIPGEIITFTGSGVTPSLQAVTTDGVDFIGDVNLVSCPAPANPSPGDCVPDELSTLDPDGSDNIVLHLGVGGKISFPEGTMGAKLWIQDMGATPFKYVVEEGNNVFQPEAVSSGSLGVIPIVQITSGFSTVGADFVPNGLKEITITEVGGSANSGSVGIAAVLTTNPDGNPAEQHQINFEEFTAGPKTSPFAVNAGHFFSVGFAQNTESNGPLDVTAFSSADFSNTEEYNVLFNTQGTQGEGAAPADDVLGGSITVASCQVDADNDGVCKTWEETGIIPGSDIPGVSAAVSFALPAGDGNRADDDSRRDIYVEIDCMLQVGGPPSNYCPTATELNAVITAFSRENIRLTMSLTGADITLPYKDPFHIWSANDGDADLRNDFENIKKDFFGTPTERSQGTAGTLRSGKDLLEIKSQIYHYGLFVKNINTGNNVACGPSGQAELRGNDFIVALGCGFTGAKGSTQEIQGTLMHELGHNLGLTHGGLDDDNCKPNHISVMSYSRQLPWAQLAATNSGTTVNWVLTYSREDLDNLNGPLDERAVIESDGLGVTPGQWSGTLPAGYQFKLIWGQPPNIRIGITGASVNWDTDGSPAEGVAYSQDLNKINGMVGCNPGTTNLSPFQSYDEFANLDLTFRNGASMDGLVYPDPDTISELTPVVLEGVTSTFLTLEPIADVSAGGQITATGILTDFAGDPIANEVITFSGSGAENLPSATTDIDGRYASSGNSPSTVATDWEVEAHFEGTANNGPSNSNVENYDTLADVTFSIAGFYAPVDMKDSNGDPIVNTIKSGRSVALKFEVFDNNNVEQTSTTVVESFKAQKINCATLQGEPVDPIEVTNTGGTSLRYDVSGGTFIQNWKTPSGQAGSCYTVTLDITNGTPITAYFRFT